MGMTDLIRPVEETITVRPALACRLSGLTPHDLRGMATPDAYSGPVPVRSAKFPLGTEYRLDDLLVLLGTMADLGMLDGTSVEDEEVPF